MVGIMQSVSSLLSMEIDGSDVEPGTTTDGSTAKKSKRCKRKSFMVNEEGQMGSREKLAKKILLSLTRPSYVLGLGPKPLRKEHRTRLRYLLRRLVNQHHWVEASGVLSAYIKGTLNETSPFRNRLKFWVLMELLNRVKNNSINPTRIKNLYDIWSKKIGSMNTWPLQSRYAVHFEFIFFCLMQGNAGDAYQLALCIEQNKVDIDPVLKMMMGLTFYELWYSSIPKEFQWRNTDHFDMQENSHMEISFTNKTGQSERYNSVESHMAESHCQRDSDASIMNDKHISRDVVFSEDIEVGTNKREKTHQNFQPEGFYLNSEEQNGFGDPFSNSGGLTQDILHGLGGLDLWLLPLHFSDESNLEEFMYLQIDQPNDYYKNSVKYLQLALNSEPSASATLLPLVQDKKSGRTIGHAREWNGLYCMEDLSLPIESHSLISESSMANKEKIQLFHCRLGHPFPINNKLLLMGGQVDEALNMLEKQCCNAASVLPLRVRAALLERFDRNNSGMLLIFFENILKKDPTCSDALAKLIKMHQNGEYSLESMLEMIALHLDATDSEHNTWKVLSSCFLTLYSYEEDCMSSCPMQTKNGHKQLRSFDKTPKIFTDGTSGKSWYLRCRWWITRHFSNSKLESEIESGDLQLLTCKAACASYMYGREFSYVEKAYSHLEKENDKELLSFLDKHRGNSLGIYKKFRKKLNI